MKIRLFGQRGILGGGVHYSNFSDALKKIHYIGDLVENIDVRNPTEFGQGVQSSQDNDVNIWFWQHPEIQHFKGVNVVWAIFESDKLPNYLIEYYQKYAKLLWVPSQWGKEVLINNGIDEAMIDVVPEGVDANQYHPYLRKSIDKTGEPFRFLSIGKFEERKGYRELLEAFKLAFDNSPEFELVIKADYFLDPENKKQQCINLINEVGLKNVKLIWGELTTVQLFELYNFADVYVTATRAEGWGLPIIVTLLPFINTNYGGVDDDGGRRPSCFSQKYSSRYSLFRACPAGPQGPPAGPDHGQAGGRPALHRGDGPRPHHGPARRPNPGFLRHSR
jgi:glycosyltransferase involved in cell wall biosynthesis